MYRRLPRLALNYLGGSRLCSTQAVQERIANLVKENKVVVFMKGTPEQPMCGFSRAVAQILEMHEVGRENITTHDVLEDDSIRSGIKEFSSWPTVPQVYIQGEFVGGCDIMLELHKSGDLIEHLKEVGIKSALDVEDS